MNDTTIFGQLITPKEVVKINTTIAKECKSFELWVRYMQIKNRVRIQLTNALYRFAYVLLSAALSRNDY
jgi:hypothetical protein